MILLNNMDTFIKALNLHIAMIIQIIQCISILPTKKRMELEGEAEVEGTEMQTGILVAPAPGDKDLEVTLAHTVLTTEVQGPVTQGHLPWMDLMDPTGEEKMWAGI